MLPKAGEVRLSGDEYRAVVNAAYTRDRWQCRRCSIRQMLTPHHLIKRSAQRLDTVENLVTLCVICHGLVEAGKVSISGLDANAPLHFHRH